MLGFLCRDLALVVLVSMLSRRNRGDIGAIALLFALYVLLPAIVKGMNYDASLLLFFPRTGYLLWLSPALAWSEAVLATALTVGSLALPKKNAAVE